MAWRTKRKNHRLVIVVPLETLTIPTVLIRTGGGIIARSGSTWPEAAKRSMAYPFFTIGHATRPIGEFIDLLQAAQVALVADVRTVPRSRANPQYNSDALPPSLAACSIGYEHIASLGGLRSRKRQVSRELNAFWQNDSFHNYADYAMSEAFRAGLAHLRDLGRERRCAIMCAETLWWRCHRRIITDYLLAAGETVFHILGRGEVTSAAMNQAARIQPSGDLTYPADSTE